MLRETMVYGASFHRNWYVLDGGVSIVDYAVGRLSGSTLTIENVHRCDDESDVHVAILGSVSASASASWAMDFPFSLPDAVYRGFSLGPARPGQAPQPLGFHRGLQQPARARRGGGPAPGSLPGPGVRYGDRGLLRDALANAIRAFDLDESWDHRPAFATVPEWEIRQKEGLIVRL